MTELPTYDAHDRHDLLGEAARLAFQIEAAERHGHRLELLRLRVRFHGIQAELLARITAWDTATQARNEQTREEHLARAREYQRELERQAEIRAHRRQLSLPDTPIGSLMDRNGRQSAAADQDREEHEGVHQPNGGSPRGV